MRKGEVKDNEDIKERGEGQRKNAITYVNVRCKDS